MNFKPTLKAQTGFIRNSVVLDPYLYYFSDPTKKQQSIDDFNEAYGPYCYGKIAEVPNRSKGKGVYKILYDIEKGFPDGVDLDQLSTEFPAITQVKEMMKKAIERANMIDYRYNQ